MRILLIGPTGGGASLPPYLTVLTHALRGLGHHVDRLGYPTVPYDTRTGRFWPLPRIEAAARGLLDTVDLGAYDVISLHYGNLEIEQLLPVLWAGRDDLPAVVYHVHCLAWTLFDTYVPDEATHLAVQEALHTMDGLVCFGTYAQQRLRPLGVDAPSAVSWLPTTIPTGTPVCPDTALTRLRIHSPRASLYGYAAPWKDAAGLLTACDRTRHPATMVLAGPFWDDPTQAGADLRDHVGDGRARGATRLLVDPTYIDASRRRALVAASDYALFPYRHHRTFQGSGAIADYLAHGVPVVATDVANMRELVDDAGIVVAPGDPDALAEAMDRLATDPDHLSRLADNARRRAPLFTAAHHAAGCLRLYRTAIDSKATR